MVTFTLIVSVLGFALTLVAPADVDLADVASVAQPAPVR
jgi:hypothetical protein